MIDPNQWVPHALDCLKEEFGTFRMPTYTSNDSTGPNDYFAHSGIGTAVLKEAMTINQNG